MVLYQEMIELAILDDDCIDWFPPTNQSLTDPNGLLAIGGDLRPERILAAYRQGIFPWPLDDKTMMWWSPDPRMILRPEDFHISHSLKKTIRRENYSISINTDFSQVIAKCAQNKYRKGGTWIIKDIKYAYTKMYQLGHAHSVEVFMDDKLSGGLYGIAMGGVFFGESMFHICSDCSKLALFGLCQHMQTLGMKLIDCQVETDLLASLGAKNISRNEFEKELQLLTKMPIKFFS